MQRKKKAKNYKEIRLLQLEKHMGDKTTWVGARGIGSSTVALPYCKIGVVNTCFLQRSIPR